MKDAEKGMFLNRSKKTSINNFFDRRMESGLNKTSPKWYIVNEDLENVYFGKLQRKGSFVAVNPFYRVKKEKLDSLFPGYREIDGKYVKARVFQAYVKPIVKERLLPICPDSYKIEYSNRTYKLTKSGIESDIKFVGKCYERKEFSAKIKLTLDPQNLDILQENINIK